MIAPTAVLIGLRLPAVQSVRDAAAAQAARELRTKSYVDALLCTPPFCNSLAAITKDVSVPYPAIPTDIEIGAVRPSGLRVRYDPADLDTQRFGLHPWDEHNIHDPGIVTVDALLLSLVDTCCAIEAVDWLDGGLDFTVRQTDGSRLWKLRGLATPATQAVNIVEASVPEPAGLPLFAVALLGLAVSYRWATSPRSKKNGVCHPMPRSATATQRSLGQPERR